MVIPIGEVDGVLDMAAEIGCRVGQLPTVYLGLPLGAPNRAVSVWDGVEERMRRRLTLWKRQYLSKGGRITLIKEYAGQHSLISNCLRLSTGKRSLGGGQGRQMGRSVLECGRKILKESTWCWENMGFKVGKGNRIRFWTDLWCGNNVLSQGFPNLFSMAAHRNVTVEECWDQNMGQGGWNLGLLRDLNDWEVGMVGNLLAVLRDYNVNVEDDSVFWKKGGEGLFKSSMRIMCW
ncbi:hypothetical protein CK203_084191 [Vitis vinifera]|uniref:Uncharacterized protein n=1 Tax=Vitis vinifera TaxID=29760 RepID=A0A438DRD6_VITVI|nr:hypothetical protein CK203_084191 [Vitis vinifera]